MKRPSAGWLAVPVGIAIGILVAGVPSRTAVPPSVSLTTTSTTTTSTPATTTAPTTTAPTTTTATTTASITTTTVATPGTGTRSLLQPAQVRVEVANGSGKANLGKAYSDLVKARGYTVGVPVTALQRSAVTVLYARDGFQREAASFLTAMNLRGVAVARLPAPATLINPAGSTGDLLLVIGRDRAG